jgi:hypothetical protein
MADGKHPWRPGILRDRQQEDFDELLYVVVEERIDDTIGLVVAEWPAGGDGPPRFRQGGLEFEAPADRTALQERLSGRRVDSAAVAAAAAEPAALVPVLQAREITVGDVFAIRPALKISADTDPQDLRDCEWIGEAFDITAVAREAAKVAMYEALTPPLDPAVTKRLLDEKAAAAAAEGPV